MRGDRGLAPSPTAPYTKTGMLTAGPKEGFSEPQKFGFVLVIVYAGMLFLPCSNLSALQSTAKRSLHITAKQHLLPGTIQPNQSATINTAGRAEHA